MTAAELPVDTLVALKGLKKASHLNGRRGIVVTSLAPNGRMGIHLFPKHEKHIVQAKPSNLLKEHYQLEDMDEGVHIECCKNCGASHLSNLMQVCSKCKVVPYCSRKCQKAHWKFEHKKVCEAFRELRKDPKSTNVQLSPPDHMCAVIGISSRHKAKGDLPAAVKVIEDAIPGSHAGALGSLYNSLSLLYEAQGRLDEAVEILRVAVTLSDDRVTLHKNLGTALIVQGDYEAALVEFKKAMKMGPSCEDLKKIWSSIGHCCLRLGSSCGDLEDLDGMMRYYEEATGALREHLLCAGKGSAITNEHVVAHHKLALFLYLHAQDMLKHAHQAGSSNESVLMLGHSSRDALEECIEHWTKATKFDPSNENYKMLLARAQKLLASLLLQG